MLSKIRRVFEVIWYKLRFGNTIKFDGIPNFVRGTSLKTQNGKLIIGKHFTLKPGAYLAAVNGGCITVGEHVGFNRNAIVVSHESITIGDRCLFGPNVLIYDHDHAFGTEGVVPGFKTAPIIIERGCWIGGGAVILQGSHIGEYSVIGAGTVVKGTIPPRSKVTSDRRMQIQPIAERNADSE